jgi:WD40 repeat protein
VDWGDAPDVRIFKGRQDELEMLGTWVQDDHCRVIALLGLGGLGKTMLAARLAHAVAPGVQCLFWRSLRNAMPFNQWLDEAIRFLSARRQRILPASLDDRLALLRALLREQRCVLVLDNWETVLASDQLDGAYRSGYQDYGRLLEMLGRIASRSCVILTSREMPPELVPLEADEGPVRALHLRALDAWEGRALLRDRQLQGGSAVWQALVRRCGGNALALRVIGAAIDDLFAGDISAFLAAGAVVTGNIRHVLDEQAARLSSTERSLLTWLVVEREPRTFGDLTIRLAQQVERGEVQGALAALRRRSVIERGARGAFSLQPVVLEYLTDRLVETISTEIREGRPDLLVRHPLLLAQARDHVRQTQERLILAPILARLARLQPDGQLGVVDLLLALLARWRGRPHSAQGYGPGSVVNLLRLLRGHLRGLDLSRLAIHHAYLQQVEMQDTSLAGAHLIDCTLAENFDTVHALALSAGRQILVAGTNSGELKIWRGMDRVLRVNVQAHQGIILAVALGPEERLVASGGVDGPIKLWDIEHGSCRAVLPGHHGMVNGLAISVDGEILASAGHDGTVRLWDIASGACLQILEGHHGWVRCVVFSTDGHMLMSGGEDGTVRIWDRARGACRQVLSGHDGAVSGLVLGANGILASSGIDGTIRLWDLPGGRCRAILTDHRGPIYALALSGDGQLLASGGQDHSIRLWHSERGECLDVLHGHRAAIWAISLAADGSVAASSSFDGMVQLWDLTERQPLAMLQGRADQLFGVALDRTGALMAVAGPDQVVRLWDRASGHLLAAWQSDHGLPTAVALSQDGLYLAIGGEDGSITLHTRAGGQPPVVLAGHAGYVRALAFSGNGRLLASGGQDGTVRIWAANPAGYWEQLAVLQEHEGIVYGVAISADGTLLASGGDDGIVRLWDVRSRQRRAALRGHTALVRNVALSSQGAVVASASRDGTVRLWHTGTGEPLAVLVDHAGPVHGVSLSADGQRVAGAGYQDATVRVWSIGETPEATRCLAVFPVEGRLPDHVALDAAGKIVAATGGDGGVALWDVESRAPLRTLRPDRPYERLNTTGLTGITAAQHATLLALGALADEGGNEARHPRGAPGYRDLREPALDASDPATEAIVVAVENADAPVVPL